MLKLLLEKFTKGNKRSKKAKINILYLMLIKGVSICINLLIIPVTIKYVSASEYGIWLTLSSMIAWISFFDIGFSNGLRNRLAESISDKNYEKCKELVSTAFVFLTIVFSVVWIVLIIGNVFINWSSLLNAPVELNNEIQLIAFILCTYFCIQFVLRIITTILISDQKPAAASLVDVSGQVFAFLFIIALVYLYPEDGSLLVLGIAFTVFPLLILILSNIYLLKGKYNRFAPSIRYFRKSSIKEVFGLGFKFFVIQIAGIIQYQTANFLIAHYFKPHDVTVYNIAFRYFGVLNMLFNILLAPQWTAVTDAYYKRDFCWIKKAVRSYIIIAVVFAIIGFSMLWASPIVYKIWLGKDLIDIPFDVSLYTAIFFITANFSGIFVSVINGIGAVKLQFYISFITPLIFLATSYIMISKFNLGISSILKAMVFANVSGLILAPIQYYMITKGRRGIWVS